MTEIRCSLGDIYRAPRRLRIKQFKQGDPFFVYHPDTTLIASISNSGGKWEQSGGPEVAREMVEVLGAHIDADPKIGGW